MHAIVAERIFTGRTADPFLDEGALVYDDQGMILEIGPARFVLDGKRSFTSKTEIPGLLLPGLIDAHTHICMAAGENPGAQMQRMHPAKIAAVAIEHLRAHLEAGVTTIRDLGGVHGIDLEMQRLVDEGVVFGPSVVAAGHVLCCTGGHACFMGTECDSPDEFRKAARQNVKDGARVLKLIATGGVITEGVSPGAQQLSEDEMRAVVEVAARAGLRTSAHAQGAEGIDAALRAGVSTIEHGFWLSDFALEWMHENEIALVPTFSALLAMVEKRDALPAFIQHKLDVVIGPQKRSFLRADKAALLVVTGTDAGTPGNAHGDIARELRAFQNAGVSLVRTLAAATGFAAAALGLKDRGTLARGMRADLVAFPSRWTEGFRDAPLLVVKGGVTC